MVMSLLIEKLRNYLVVPEDFVCTSKPQTWHKPHGDKIKWQEIQSPQVGSYKTHRVMTDISSKFLNIVQSFKVNAI